VSGVPFEFVNVGKHPVVVDARACRGASERSVAGRVSLPVAAKGKAPAPVRASFFGTLEPKATYVLRLRRAPSAAPFGEIRFDTRLLARASRRPIRVRLDDKEAVVQVGSRRQRVRFLR
jgi:hypothetical protein